MLIRSIEVGQTVAASMTAPVLFTLAEDLTKMELQVDVDEADVGLVEAGQNATFTVDAYPNRNFPAKIKQVRYGAESTDGVVTYTTLLEVSNPEMKLRPGDDGNRRYPGQGKERNTDDSDCCFAFYARSVGQWRAEE
ncbi:efflux RND transporter periplasmic adaptor subunit [Thiomicrorhabdus sp.]|uniref:efflux RND transporter periplasmic adaptor subunit n=1 Tax=Thiomicrorhabdus sp. TaxID=2039724 RepID=UPI0029C8B3B1|nr:HlyD family efflux transporter periplasmic adaptor subunit [Thiomicrorhabdus sp.]